MLKQIKEEFAKTLNYLLGNEKFADEPKIYQPEEISISERVVGGKVELVNNDGTLSPIPDGEIELADGFKFTVKDGLITAIDGEAPAEHSKEMADGPVEESASDSSAIEDLKKTTEALKAEIDQLKTMLDDLKAANADTANKDEVENFRKELSNLNETIKKVANVPAEFSKTTKSNVAKDEQSKSLNDLAKIFASTKQ